MARFYGKVGYGESVEEPADSGIWVDMITERDYQGDIIRNTRNSEPSEGLNDDITVSNSISILADQHAIENFIKIKYVMWAGVRWAVKSIEVRSPRLILSLGGAYNGPDPTP